MNDQEKYNLLIQKLQLFLENVLGFMPIQENNFDEIIEFLSAKTMEFSTRSSETAKIKALFEISVISENYDQYDNPYQDILEQLRSIIPYSRATLFIYQNKELKEAAGTEKRAELLQSFTFGNKSGFSSWSAKQQRPILIKSLKEGDRRFPDDIASFISVPLLSSGHFLGILNMAASLTGAFTEEELKIAEIVANMITTIIARNKQLRELATANAQLKETLKKQKLLQKKIVASEKLKALNEMVVTLNHEINNPLASILGRAQMLLHRFRTQETTQPKIIQELEIIEKDSQHIARLITQLENIVEPVSKIYVDDIRMIDIEKSTKKRRK